MADAEGGSDAETKDKKTIASTRVTPSEHRRIEEAACRAQLSVAEFLRACALGRPIGDQTYSALISKLIQLARFAEKHAHDRDVNAAAVNDFIRKASEVVDDLAHKLLETER